MLLRCFNPSLFINIIFIVMHLSLGASLSVQPRPGNRTPVANKTKQKPVSDRIIALNGFTVFSLKPAIFVLAPPRRLMDVTEKTGRVWTAPGALARFERASVPSDTAFLLPAVGWSPFYSRMLVASESPGGAVQRVAAQRRTGSDLWPPWWCRGESPCHRRPRRI